VPCTKKIINHSRGKTIDLILYTAFLYICF
jgi:hypothetical protein